MERTPHVSDNTLISPIVRISIQCLVYVMELPAKRRTASYGHFQSETKSVRVQISKASHESSSKMRKLTQQREGISNSARSRPDPNQRELEARKANHDGRRKEARDKSRGMKGGLPPGG